METRQKAAVGAQNDPECAEALKKLMNAVATKRALIECIDALRRLDTYIDFGKPWTCNCIEDPTAVNTAMKHAKEVIRKYAEIHDTAVDTGRRAASIPPVRR
jgi:methionyl-tRNA synthetase